MKCFEKLVLSQFISGLPSILDPFPFAHCLNRSTEDVISAALYSALTHLENNNSYLRMLFIDYSSAFNTVIPTNLIIKLMDRICSSICSWILDFLPIDPSLWGWAVICPQLSFWALVSHRVACWVRYATLCLPMISNNETAYREEIQNLAAWFSPTILLLMWWKTDCGLP